MDSEGEEWEKNSSVCCRFLSIFHFPVVGSTLCLLWAGWGDISWASLLEEEHRGTTVGSLPVVALPQCVSEAGQVGCPLSPSDTTGQIHIPVAPHLLPGVSGTGTLQPCGISWGEMDLPGISHPQHCLPIYVPSSFLCIVFVFCGTQKQYQNHSCVLPHH